MRRRIQSYFVVAILFVFLSVSASLYGYAATATPTPVASAWNVGATVQVKVTIPFSWIRTAPNSSASTIYTVNSGGSLVLIAPPQFDGIQWWWKVSLPDTPITGWVEQASLELASTLATNGPTIIYFAADKTTITAGSSVTLRWKFVGAPSAYITSNYMDPNSFVKTKLPPEGSLEVPVASLFKDGPSMMVLTLVLTDESGTTPLRHPEGHYYTAQIYTTFISDITVDFFTANVSTASPGDTVSLSWKTTLATRVSIDEVSAAQYSPYATFNNLNPTGSLQVTLPKNVYYEIGFNLHPENANGPGPSSTTLIKIRCPHSYFFTLPGKYSSSCPADEAKQVQAIYEPFQNGMMIWRADQHLIYVLFSHATFSETVFGLEDTWKDGDTPGTATPPTGLYQPVGRLGKAWFSMTVGPGPLKDEMGWATAPEQAYTMTVQPEAKAYWELGDTEFFSLPDGSVVFQWASHDGTGWSLIQ